MVSTKGGNQPVASKEIPVTISGKNITIDHLNVNFPAVLLSDAVYCVVQKFESVEILMSLQGSTRYEANQGTSLSHVIWFFFYWFSFKSKKVKHC